MGYTSIPLRQECRGQGRGEPIESIQGVLLMMWFVVIINEQALALLVGLVANPTATMVTAVNSLNLESKLSSIISF
jgi:hypothetical protein